MSIRKIALTITLCYFLEQSAKPQTIGYALDDSPAGLAAWIVEKFRSWSDSNGDVETSFTRDDLLTNITPYWVTQTATSSARITDMEKPTRWMAVVAVIALLCATAAAQTEQGRIAGTLNSLRGPLPAVDVRIKNVTTGETVVVKTTRDGEYSATVKPGTYDVFASPTGYTPLARRQVVVAAGATVHVDGVLTDNPNAGTPGEIFFLYSREGRKAPVGPTPRMADGKPDLSGMWLPGADLEPELPPLQAWAAAKARENASRPGDDPRAQCLPSGVVRTSMLDLAKFVHTKGLLVILTEGSVPGVRQVFLDGRKHPADPSPTWLGYSIGTWDHDTLVVDTIGFNDKGWIDNAGHPQTERLHVIERFRRPDLGHLELEITIDDPGAYTKPWKVRRSLILAPDEEIREYICNENHHTEHFRPN